jgi:hypothetical protein
MMEGEMQHASWVNSPRAEGYEFINWQRFSSTPYISFTHSERFAANHANAIAAETYGQYEEIDEMPVGGIIAKPTFTIGHNGEAMLETLFLMERAETGTMPVSGDWIYTSINADGSVWGRTGGHNSAGMDFCVACHEAMGQDTDSLTFLPPEYRIRN